MTARFPHPSSLLEICQRIDGRIVRGSPHLVIGALASLESAGASDLSFLAFANNRAVALSSRAAAVLSSAALASGVNADAALIEVADPYFAYSMLARWIEAEQRQRLDPSPGMASSATVDVSAVLGERIAIGPNVVIGASAVIGDDCRIGAGTVIGAGSRIGAHSRLAANVSIAHDCEIGQRAIVHSGTVIGSDGFGFAPSGVTWAKIPQLGQVLIGHDVEIGANCAIDRGALDPTVIGDGCKLDNLIQIAHNVRVGEHTAIAGCVGIAGSAIIGARCRIGGGAGILGHLEICDDVTISAMSLVTRSIRKPGFYTGVYPLQDNAQWEKTAATLKQLPGLRERLRFLEKSHGRES
jgi:UDP-3-O-[3-hydroxymyristoyl] glucosamine N-acyltransferase